LCGFKSVIGRKTNSLRIFEHSFDATSGKPI